MAISPRAREAMWKTAVSKVAAMFPNDELKQITINEALMARAKEASAVIALRPFEMTDESLQVYLQQLLDDAARRLGTRRSSDESQEGNNDHPSKPTRPHSSPDPSSSAHTIRFGSPNIDTCTKFRNVKRSYDIENIFSVGSIEGTVDACTVPISNDMLHFVVKRLFTRVYSVVNDYSYRTEHGMVQLLREAFQEVCNTLHMTDCEQQLDDSAVADAVVIDEATSKDDCVRSILFGMEWRVYVKQTLRGSIELHFMKEVKVKDTQSKTHVFVGAMEVGLGLIGRAAQDKVVQAEKETLGMHMYNAERGYYHKVWVLLTDGIFVARIVYEGDNHPNSQHGVYQQGMPCSAVHGRLKATKGAQLWATLPQCEVASTTFEAVRIMIGGLLESEQVSRELDAEKAIARVTAKAAAIERRANDVATVALAQWQEADERAKKRRVDADAEETSAIACLKQ